MLLFTVEFIFIFQTKSKESEKPSAHQKKLMKLLHLSFGLHQSANQTCKQIKGSMIYFEQDLFTYVRELLVSHEIH